METITIAEWDRAKRNGYTLGSPATADARMLRPTDQGTALVPVVVVCECCGERICHCHGCPLDGPCFACDR